VLTPDFKKYISKIIELQKTKLAQNTVPVSGKVFDEKELEYAIESILDCHWTE
jgi:hypothetical protein